MKNNKKTCPDNQRGRFRLAGLAVAVGLGSQAPAVLAGDTVHFDNGATMDWSLMTSYGIGMRVDSPDDNLLVDINGDDANRNFDRGSLVTHRVSALGEVILRKDAYGAVVRANAFYDDVYNSGNDHDAPARANKYGDHDEFTSGTQYYSGGRMRFLDAYVFGGWRFDNGQALDVNAGRHVVAWGESLFYPGVSGAQSPADAVKGSLPGVEVKEIFLPVGQVSALWNINPQFSLGGYVQYEWKGTELPPVGSYLSTSDIIGPGRDFIRAPIPLGPAGVFNHRINYAGTDEPRDSGQWGMQVRYRPNFDWELSAFHVRYHDKSPAGVTNYNGLVEVMPGFDLTLPTEYRINYYEDIKLTGLSFSTRLGDTQVSGEWSYRDGAPVNVLSPQGTPQHTRGKGQQYQMSFVHLLGDRPWADQTSLTGEIVHVRASSVSDHPQSGSDDFTFKTATAWQSKTATAYQVGAELSYPGTFSGWDMIVPLRFSHVVEGAAPLQGAIQGAKGDMRLSMGTTFRRLGNFEVALNYNAFLGEPDRVRRKLADRDYVTLAAKYSF
jgi:hypothetical protein